MKVLKIKDIKISLFDANNFFLRLSGLIGREIDDYKGLILTPCNQIHTFLMKYPIDALFISEDNTILHIEESIKPNKMIKKVKKAKSIVELKSGLSKNIGFQVGNKINIYVEEK